MHLSEVSGAWEYEESRGAQKAFDKNTQWTGIYCNTNYVLLQAFPLFDQLKWQSSVN